MSAPVLSICIVTYKSRDLLCDCLKSISENTRLSWESIVVDNGSNDGVGQLLAQEYPDVRFIQNDANLGYTRPMNQALRQGQGRFLMQLNPDTQILPETLDTMVAFMEEHPEIGVMGPKVLNRDRHSPEIVPARRVHTLGSDHLLPRPFQIISIQPALRQIPAQLSG